MANSRGNHGSIVQVVGRLPIIRKSIWMLHRAFKTDNFYKDWPTFNIPSTTPARADGGMIYVQWIAKKVAQHYRLNDITFVVSRNPLLASAAQVWVHSGNVIYVEFRELDLSFQTQIWAIMAHEIAHIFLDRLNLRFANKLENEILTDTTSIYLGFGSFFLNASWDEITAVSSNQTKTTKHRIGYISEVEAGYILSRRDKLLGENSSKDVISSAGRDAYEHGARIFLNEQNSRPFIKRSFIDRLIHRFDKKASEVPELILLDCIVCSQPIRIPALYKTLLVKCPNCCTRVRCFS